MKNVVKFFCERNAKGFMLQINKNSTVGSDAFSLKIFKLVYRQKINPNK
jgi:hypothetical protein